MRHRASVTATYMRGRVAGPGPGLRLRLKLGLGAWCSAFCIEIRTLYHPRGSPWIPVVLILTRVVGSDVILRRNLLLMYLGNYVVDKIFNSSIEFFFFSFFKAPSRPDGQTSPSKVFPRRDAMAVLEIACDPPDPRSSYLFVSFSSFSSRTARRINAHRLSLIPLRPRFPFEHLRRAGRMPHGRRVSSIVGRFVYYVLY